MIDTTNEIPYQTSKCFEPAKEASCQSPENIDWIAESYEKLIDLSSLSANWDGCGGNCRQNMKALLCGDYNIFSSTEACICMSEFTSGAGH